MWSVRCPGGPYSEARTASWGQRVKGCICYPGTVSYLPEGDADSLKIFEQGNDMTAFVVWEGNSSNHAE